MAVPLLTPLFWLLPLIKILALGSIKFIGVGIGAAVAPVMTANFLVGLSSGTPLKYAKFRHQKGLFTQEQMELVERANKLVINSIDSKEERLSTAQAREFLKEVLIGTVASMKQSFVSIPAALVRVSKQMKAWITKPFSPGDN